MSTASPFEHRSTFEPGELASPVRLGKLEAHYEELFAEVIEDGIITAEERARLDRAAEVLGLDVARIHQVEEALRAAYESRNRVRIHEAGTPSRRAAPALDDDARTSLSPLEPSSDLRVQALERRIVTLEARIAELENELDEARAQGIDVDLSGVTAEPAGEDPEELARRLRHDPRDEVTLHALFRAFGREGDPDRRWCAAHALAYLRAMNDEESTVHAKRPLDGLIRPQAALQRESWIRLLFHPDAEPLVGEIFSAVSGPVLLGRISALRHAGTLPKLDPARRQDPATSTVQAVRCFSWAAAILGMPVPPLYADPEFPGLVELVPATTPALRLGKQALSGRSPAELAFLAGQHLSCFRQDHFVRSLLPSILDLEDVFLAALSIGNPGMPLNAASRARVAPIVKAIEPLLEPPQIDRLRGHFLRFVEEGGRTNLQRWSNAVEATAARAGLLLANDLGAAKAMLALADPEHVEPRMDDLLTFVTGDRYAMLRKQLGIAIE